MPLAAVRMPSREQRSLEFANALGRLYVALQDVTLPKYEHEFRRLEARLLPRARGAAERREWSRRVQEELLIGASNLDASSKTMTRLLKRMQRLGYSNVERRVHIAFMYSSWAKGRRRMCPTARALLVEAERRVQKLRGGAERHRLEEALTRARRGLEP